MLELVWHWVNLVKHHYDIIEAAEWLEPKILLLVNFDRFAEIYKRGPIS